MTKVQAAVLAIAMLVASFFSYKFAEYKTLAQERETQDSLAGEVAALKKANSDLKMTILEQNQSIAVAEAKASGADEARKIALEHAAQLNQISQSRIRKLMDSLGSMTSCSEVLKSFWESRQ